MVKHLDCPVLVMTQQDYPLTYAIGR